MMDGNIRVKTDRCYQTLYNHLKDLAFVDMHEIFFLCACLGYLDDRRKSLGKSGDERFWSKTITPDEWACFYAMRLTANGMDFKSLQDDKAVISEMEEYANAGIEIFIDDLLCDYLKKNVQEPSLDAGVCRELPKVVLGYIFEKIPESLD